MASILTCLVLSLIPNWFCLSRMTTNLLELVGDLEGVLTPSLPPEEQSGVLAHALTGVGKTTRVQQWRMGLLLVEFKSVQGWTYYEQPSLGHWLIVNQDNLGISETQGRTYLENAAFYLHNKVLLSGSSANKWLHGFRGLGITQGDEFSALMDVNHYNLYAMRRILVKSPREQVLEHLFAASQIENREQMIQYRNHWLGVDIPPDKAIVTRWNFVGSVPELINHLETVGEPKVRYAMRLEVLDE